MLRTELRTEHLTGNVRLVPIDRLPLALAAIRFLEAVERGEQTLRFQAPPQ